MKRFALVLALSLLSSAVFAQGMRGRTAVSGAFGFYGAGPALGSSTSTNSRSPALAGLFGLGGDFEYFISADTSIGGIFRYYMSSDKIDSGGSSTEYSESLMTLGGLLKAYLVSTPNWDGYLSTGLGFASVSYKQKPTGGNETTVDPSAIGVYMGLGALYKMSPSMAFGFENLRMMALGDKLNGWPLNDFMAKARFTF